MPNNHTVPNKQGNLPTEGIKRSLLLFMSNSIPSPITQAHDTLDSDSNPAMGKLASARAELARLESREQQLVEQLCNIRVAIRVRRAQLEELVKRIPASIDRLPNELLLRIFEHCIDVSVLEFPSVDMHRYCKGALAAVSRRWRDVVLYSPSLWTTIKVTPTWSRSLVKAHVARSSQSLLEVEICSWKDGPIQETLLPLLDVLIPCAHRWRSLVIRSDVSSDYINASLERINQATYPSLTHISILAMVCSGTSKISEFYSRSCPRLKYLRGRFQDLLDFRVPPSVTSLDFCHSYDLSILQHLSLQQLTTLRLSGGCVAGVHLDPDSIHLPLLEMFICTVANAKVLIQAIVAPKLVRFEYSLRHAGIIQGDMFKSHTPKFHNVTHLLSGLTITHSAEVIPSVFPAVRHITLDRQGFISLFPPERDHPVTPAHWPHLERLTAHGAPIMVSEPNSFSEAFLYSGLGLWLEKRHKLGQPRLLVRVSFTGSCEDDMMSMLYLALHEYCVLELVNVCSEGIEYSGTVDESLWLIDSAPVA
ncbi:hypothetical protein J3A83DRAFT_4188377 [Scleroderma citrinum]